MREEIFKDEMKAFEIEVDDIEPNEHIFGALEKTIHKMKNEYLVHRLEVVLNNNLIETRDKITNYRTILGCRVSYDDLPKDVSFIVRPDEKPSYEILEQENQQLKDRINKAIFYMENYISVEEYNEPVKCEFGIVIRLLKGDKE